MDLTIGELARRSGYAVQTLRYYEQIGLMPKPPRTSGGQRRYGQELQRRLLFIRHARDLGFEIEDIRSLLDLASRPDQPVLRAFDPADLQWLEAHLVSIDEKIARLTALRAEVDRMLKACATERIAECKVIDVLTRHSE